LTIVTRRVADGMASTRGTSRWRTAWIRLLGEFRGDTRKTTELPEPFGADTAAATVVTYLQGLFRVARILTDRTHLERQVEAPLSGLD
jgi:hypothetical protein